MAVFDEQTACGRLAREPWAEPVVQRRCFRWQWDEAERLMAGSAADAWAWIERQLAEAAGSPATDRAAWVWTETPMNQAALSEWLAAAGFFPVGASLRLRVDAGHAIGLAPRDEPLRLRLADFDTLVELVGRACQWHGGLANAWHDAVLGKDAGRRYRAAAVAERWRSGMRLYACERCDGAPPLGMVGVGADAAGRAVLECFAVAEADGQETTGRLDEVLSAALRRCFAQGRSIVEATVPADDLVSIGRLLAMGFSLQGATLRWHGHFAAGM